MQVTTFVRPLRYIIIISFLAFGILIGFIGGILYQRLTIEININPIQLLDNRSYTLYRLNSQTDISARRLTDDRLVELMAHAKWQNKNPLWKGHWLMKFENDLTVKQSVFGSFFSVSGLPGTYRIDEENRNEYRQLIDIRMNNIADSQEHRNDPIIPND